MLKELLIHDLSKVLDMTPKAIRYYEKVGLIPAPSRNDSNYRTYSEKDLKRLDFIKKAREMNLSIDEIKTIINIKDNGQLPCNKVIDLLEEKITDLDKHIKNMIEFRKNLKENLEIFKSNYELGSKGEVCGFIENHK